MDHHVNGVVSVEVGIILGGQAEKCFLGILSAPATNKPPRRFRSE